MFAIIMKDSRKIEMEELNKEIKEKIISLVDEDYKEFHSSLCPGINNILGVRVPVLRKYAKELNAQYSLDMLFNVIDNHYYEEKMLKGMLIGMNKESDIQELINYIKSFIPLIDNWAICDVFCAGLKITKKYKVEMWRFINQYLSSNKEFEVRFAVVMILDYFIEEEYLEENFKIFDSILCDQYYVKMAVAWAISICLIKYYDETIGYLKRCNLEDDVYNKAIQKARESYRISTKQKDELNKMKRLKV